MPQLINGVELQNAFHTGYLNLKKNMTAINDLNVFPVPDGDTGTNLVHTFGGGLSVEKTENAGNYMSALSLAVLLSARGNSGVIFSQFIHGICRGFENKESICFADFTDAFRYAQEDAYKAITTPTEGTILTVIREAADFLAENAESYPDFRTGLEALLGCMQDTLSRTPLMLPVLKEAGVVDSGGAGLVCFFEGMLAFFNGDAIEDLDDISAVIPATANVSAFGPDSEMEYGYCTEFLLQLMNAKVHIPSFSIDEFVKPLEKLGDSIVAVENSGIVKLHIHTFTPEKVLAYARNFGEFVNMKIENMSVQHSEIQAAPQKEKVKYLIVAVASGQGIIDYFYSIGATEVIDGGQTNNPSVDDFLAAFEKYDAEHIVVLPNNSNIILSANQAAQIYNGDVHVIPTKSLVEGYSALSMMNLWCDTVEELMDDMRSCLDCVTSACVTTATRDTNMCDLDIKKGNYIGLEGKEILVCGDNREDVAFETIRHITDRADKEVIIIFYGANVTEDDAMALKSRLEEAHPLADIGFIEGRQDVYDYIISLE